MYGADDADEVAPSDADNANLLSIQMVLKDIQLLLGKPFVKEDTQNPE